MEKYAGKKVKRVSKRAAKIAFEAGKFIVCHREKQHDICFSKNYFRDKLEDDILFEDTKGEWYQEV